MTVSELIDRFLRHCERQGCKPTTLQHYRGRLKPLADQAGARAWAEVSREQLLDWLHQANHWPDGREKAKSTIRANMIALQMIQTYAREFHGAKRKLKKTDLKKPSPARRERIPTPDETRRILEAAPEDWRLIYRALRLTGARPMELTGALIESIEQSCLVIHEHKTARKTGKPRRIPLGKHVMPLFREAIADRTSGPVFVDSRGKPWTVGRLSRIFRRLRKELGLTPELVLYSTRHEFGSAVAKKFGILQASRLLGHTDVATTQRYTHLSDDELREYQEGALDDYGKAA